MLLSNVCGAYLSQKDESFYTLSWTIDQVDSSPLLVAAGSNRIIRVINCATEKLDKVPAPVLTLCLYGKVD
jgi:polycomb protein EED